MIRCYHCAGPMAPAEHDDSADAGIHPDRALCGDCLDIAVWGGACADCDRTDITHRRCDGTCYCTTAYGPCHR